MKFSQLIWILVPFLLNAQRQDNNWYFGAYVGMKFNPNMSVIPPKTSPMYAPYAAASYSDPQTGELLFYTNGSYVYNKYHQQMPNGFYINKETFGIHSVIVPHPGDKNLFYIFSSATYSTDVGIYYCIVDMSKENGLGNVTVKEQAFSSGLDLQFCVVKQHYEQGYWLITHVSGTDEFRCFRIGKNGLNNTPVISHAGSVSPANLTYFYGKMCSNSTGSQFVFTAGGTFNGCHAELFDFDKKCGVVSFAKSFFPYIIQAFEVGAFPAFSPDDSMVYVSWYYNSGQDFLFQYEINKADPNPDKYMVNAEGNGDLQLAPDGKIYMSSVANGDATSVIRIIVDPNKKGAACNLKNQFLDLAPGFLPGECFVTHFPQMIMDKNTMQGFAKPKPVFKNLCEGLPVSFSLADSFSADSFYWSFGDGKFSSVLNTTHQYSEFKDYVVGFHWYSCNQPDAVFDTVRLRKTPEIELGPDTILCPGTGFTLSGPPGMDEYRWSTKDSSASIKVKQAGNYVLKVRSGQCWNEDLIKISYHPGLWTELGDEYFICDKDKELVKLDAGEGFQNYLWHPTGETTQWIKVADLGNYFVVVKDFRGCNGEDKTTVKRKCPVSLFFPNAFTPNADGLNDFYTPVGTDVSSFSIKIYNRWGELVFESNDIHHQWDGTLHAKPASSGVYFYTAVYSGYFNKRLQYFDTKGNLSLIR